MSKTFNLSQRGIEEILKATLRDELAAGHQSSLNELSLAAYAKVIASQEFQSVGGLLAAVRTVVRQNEVAP